MKSPIGSYIRVRREALGISLSEAARQTEISKGTLSRIELGDIKLPNSEHRRKIARLIGVSHLDLLVAAGEITTGELEDVGAVGAREIAPDDPRVEIHALVDTVNWYGRPDRVDGITSQLQAWAQSDARHKENGR